MKISKSIRMRAPAGATDGMTLGGAMFGLCLGVAGTQAQAAEAPWPGYVPPPPIPGAGASERPAQTSSPVPAAPRHEGELEQVTVDAPYLRANPYVDPEAPLKVDLSADPRLPLPLADTPKTVTAITQEQIQRSGATSLKDVMRTQPGVTIGTGEGGNAYGDRFFIRGFDARNDVFIDGLRDPGATTRETFAVEQIEILKGPSSTIGGRGTTGAAVTLVTKQPKLADQYSGTVGIGTDNYKRGTFDVNKVITDNVQLRVNGMFHDEDIAGRDEVYSKRYGLAGAVAVQPLDGMNLTLDYYHLTIDNMPDFGVPWDGDTGDIAAVNLDNFYGITYRDYQDIRADIGTARVEYDINSDLKLDLRGRYGQTSNAYIVSAPALNTNGSAELTDDDTVRLSPKRRDQENEFIGGQANLIYKFNAGGKHTLVLGGEISREEILRYNTSYNLADGESHSPTLDALNPDSEASGAAHASRTGDFGEGVVDTKAIYLLNTYEITDQIILSGGLRYDHYDIEVGNVVDGYSDPGTYNDYSEGFLNWNAGVTYKPLPNGSIYAAASTSSNPPGEQLDGGTSASYGGLAEGYTNYEPEQNLNIEVGTKWELFDNHLAVSAAGFWTRKEGQFVSSGRGSSATFSNGGEAEVYGVEVGFAGNISPELEIYGGLVWLDTEVTNDPLNPGNNGLELANVAEWSGTLGVGYDVTDKLNVGGAVTYKSEIKGGTFAASTGNSVDDWWRVDVNASYDITDDVEVRLNVLNVFDKRYADALYRSGSPFVYIAPGRSANMTLAFDF